MASNTRAERRRNERAAQKNQKRIGQPPKIEPGNEQGVSVDVVDDAVMVSIHGINQIFTVKWQKQDAKAIAQMIDQCAEGIDLMVERESGLVVAKELPR